MTIVCIACGPSRVQSDVEACRGRATVITVNDAVFVAPWADWLYAADAKWWRWWNGVPTFKGKKGTVDPLVSGLYPEIRVFKNTGREGLEDDPDGLRTGGHSGYQAINLAVHLGARKIVLLGYDMQPGVNGEHHAEAEHPHGGHPGYLHLLPRYQTLVQPLADRGIEVINASRATAVTVFKCQSIEEALGGE